MLERDYQARIVRKLYEMFPGCFIMKNDSGHIQGILDLTILWDDMWAMLEVKASRSANVRPNQDYYVDMFNVMSFASYIYPENEEQVLNELQHTFRTRRAARVAQRQQVSLGELRRGQSRSDVRRVDGGTARNGTSRSRS